MDVSQILVVNGETCYVTMMLMSPHFFLYNTVFYTQEIQLMLNGVSDNGMMSNNTELWNLELPDISFIP